MRHPGPPNRVTQGRLTSFVVGQAVFLALGVVFSHGGPAAAQGPSAPSLATTSKLKPANPDLVVSGLSLSASSGYAGQSITVTVAIKNRSRYPAGSTTIALGLASISTINPVETASLAALSLGALNTGASVTLQTAVTLPPLEPGSYAITAQVDPGNLVNESNEGNNVRTTPLELLSEAPPESGDEEVYPPPGGPNGPHYYVATSGDDANDGSLAQPWRTIQHAAAQVTPGSTVYVAPGTYTGPIITQRDGTATSRIRFLSSTRWGARIYYTGIDYWQVWRNTGDYVDIVGFDVSGGGDVRNGIQNDASHVRIIRNYVHDIPNKGCGDSNGGAGIVNGNESASDSEILANVVHDIGNVSNPCNIIHGIYHSHLRGRIANNVTFRNQGSGIHTWHSANKVTIVNNLTFANGVAGIIVGAAGDSGVVADNFEVRNNIIVYNRYGMYESGTTGKSNRYYNNLLYGNKIWNLALGNPDYNTITENPAFVDYQPDGTGDYRLSPWSPALDAGSSVSAPTTDVVGWSRPYGASWDLGPYEWRP